VLWLLIVLANIAGFSVAPMLLLAADLDLARWTMPFLIVPSGLLGAAFPLVCHLSISADGRVGQRLSFLYGANIAGATAGTLLTGFVLMDRWPLTSLLVARSLTGLAAGLVVLAAARLPRRQSLSLAALTLAAMSAIYGLGPNTLSRLYERLSWNGARMAVVPFHDVVENRSGVITVTDEGKVYGGNVYDGAFNVDPRNKINGIFRAYALSALHGAPRRVLEIGLSSGSWAQVMANNPQMRHLTSIEINPGYLQLIRRHPEVSSLLLNPKVTVHIDDGRRWLVRHPDETFDVIVMNTTFHWRSGATNVLSADFLKLVRRHLAPGGVAYYNPTGSLDVVKTGLSVFPYALSVDEFLAVSDSPLSFDRDRLCDVLSEYRIDGHPVIQASGHEQRRKLGEIISAAQIDTRETLEERSRGYRLITDDNMRSEFK
jgi:predicted membrane-bound spermidine synthase